MTEIQTTNLKYFLNYLATTWVMSPTSYDILIILVEILFLDEEIDCHHFSFNTKYLATLHTFPIARKFKGKVITVN